MIRITSSYNKSDSCTGADTNNIIPCTVHRSIQSSTAQKGHATI